jgi:hypothetical protein
VHEVRRDVEKHRPGVKLLFAMLEGARVCACVCVCVRVRVCACVCVCVINDYVISVGIPWLRMRVFFLSFFLSFLVLHLRCR